MHIQKPHENVSMACDWLTVTVLSIYSHVIGLEQTPKIYFTRAFVLVLKNTECITSSMWGSLSYSSQQCFGSRIMTVIVHVHVDKRYATADPSRHMIFIWAAPTELWPLQRFTPNRMRIFPVFASSTLTSSTFGDSAVRSLKCHQKSISNLFCSFLPVNWFNMEPNQGLWGINQKSIWRSRKCGGIGLVMNSIWDHK